MNSKISVTLLQIGQFSDLQDHHNRPGEMLVGVSIDNIQTFEDVKAALKDKLADIDWEVKETKENLPEEKEFEEAIDAWFFTRGEAGAEGGGIFEPGAPSPNAEEDEEYPDAFFLFAWETTP